MTQNPKEIKTFLQELIDPDCEPSSRVVSALSRAIEDVGSTNTIYDHSLNVAQSGICHDSNRERDVQCRKVRD